VRRGVITYWTTASLEPEIEAISKEIFDLADHFQGSRIVSVSSQLNLLWQRRGRVIGFNRAFDPLLRAAIPLLERLTTLNHVYAEISPWIYARALKRRPTVLTIATEKGPIVPQFLQRCEFVTVQTQRMQRQVLELGVDARKCRLIYPGIDLSRFKPAVRTERDRVRIVFATFPRSAEELASRGVWFLLDMCEAHPHLEVTLVSRPWRADATALAAVRGEIARRRLGNVKVLEGLQGNMDELYQHADFTVIPYTTVDGGKECPRSLVESLACGVPVLISRPAPFSSFIERNRCGLVFDLNPESFAAQLSAAGADYDVLRERSIHSARAHFDRQATLRAYAELYEEVERARLVTLPRPDRC
jgi:glycosyltransferase involved in cell wall biosynthesis